MNKTEPSKSLSYEVSGPPVGPSSLSGQSEWEDKSEDGNLEKVRDILFGAQSREFEQRFGALERQLLEESAALRADVSRSLDDLKKQVNDEIHRVTGQLQEEQGVRTTAVKDVSMVIEQLGEKLEAKFSELKSQATQQHSIFEVNLSQQKQELTGNYEQALAQLQEQVDQGFHELKSDKTDRVVLAEMLMDVALRLKVGQQNTEDSQS